MTERPILFSGEMVRAILDGRKTQTRRVIKPQPTRAFYCWPQPGVALFTDGDPAVDYPDNCEEIRCPHGTLGEGLWVRETWSPPVCVGCDVGLASLGGCLCRSVQHVGYRATSDRADRKGWRPSIFMPRWASRIMLEIVDVRVQRLQEISDDDARAEGVTPYGHISDEQRVPGSGFDRCRLGDQPHRLPFADLWDRVNGKRAAWASNPYVWAITFRRLLP